MSGKSHGSLNRYAKKARARRRTGYSAGKHTDIKTVLKDSNLGRSPANSNKDGRFAGFSTFLGKVPQNFNYYASDFHADMLHPDQDSQNRYVYPVGLNSDPHTIEDNIEIIEMPRDHIEGQHESMSANEFSRASRQNWHRSHHNNHMQHQMVFIDHTGQVVVQETYHDYFSGDHLQPPLTLAEIEAQ